MVGHLYVCCDLFVIFTASLYADSVLRHKYIALRWKIEISENLFNSRYLFVLRKVFSEELS